MHFKSSILIADEGFFGSTNFGLAQGFRRLAWDVEIVNRPKLFNRRTLLARFITKLFNPISNMIFNLEILQAAKELKPDFFLTVKGSGISQKTLTILASRGIKTINYYPDARFTFSAVDQSTFPLYSVFITTKSYQVETLQGLIGKEKVHFIHHGYSSDVHCVPLENLLSNVEVPEVLYVGTYCPYKEDIFTGLIKRMPNISFRIYGNGWDLARDFDMLKPFLAERPIVGMSYSQLINVAKINLGIHMGVGDSSGWKDLVSTRSFEIPACKGFLLHVDNLEIRTLYDVGSEIDVFSSIDDLCAKIRFYLANEPIRKAMIEKAYHRAVPAYSYDQRAKEVAALIKLNN